MAVIGRNQFGRAAAAAEKLRNSVGALLRPGRRKAAAGRLGAIVTLVEIGLVVLLGLAAGRLATTIVSPLPVAENPPPPVRASAKEVGAGNPFRTVAAPELPADGAGAPDAAETTLDLALHGTWVEPDGGSAIIRLPGSEQKIFFVGDAICCGARLESVYPDQVIISRSGVREALRLANKRSTDRPGAPARRSAGPPAPPPAERTAPIENDASLNMYIAEVARLQPSRGPNGAFQLQLFPAGDEASFEALGFRSGDVLVSINGKAAPANLAELGQTLAGLEGVSGAEIIVERGGARVPLNMTFAENERVLSQ